MSASELVTVTLLSPHWRERTHAIDTITIHHTAAANVTAQQIGAQFTGSRVASANYGIGTGGEIGCFVPEERRAITSNSSANDNRAVTIEVANSAGGPDWPVSSASWASLILLVTDICRRNGIDELRWRADPKLVGQPDKQNMTVHQWFDATLCPGPYLMGRMGTIAAAVNARLTPEEETDMMRYNRVDQLPDWAQGTITKLCRSGILQGHTAETDAYGLPVTLDLTLDMIRLLVINDRAGVYDAAVAAGGAK